VEAAHTPEEAARGLRWNGSQDPGDWTPVVRRFGDGHEETWWAAELSLAGYGPDRSVRLVAATTDPATLPALSTWYLATNLPRPGSSRADSSPFAPADLAEIVRLYGLRIWVEQGYRQVKQELGWADFMVRADRAIRRHWQLVCCAFSFCWRAWFTSAAASAQAEPAAPAGRGENEPGIAPASPSPRQRPTPLLAGSPAPGTQLAGSVELPRTLLARVVQCAPAAGTAGAPRLGRDGPTAPPLSPAPDQAAVGLCQRAGGYLTCASGGC